MFTDQDFVIADELLQGKIDLLSWPLSQILMVNDQNYPAWFVLIPRINGLTEITDLSQQQQEILWREVGALAKLVKETCTPCKLNIASLGNIVPQLHIHITARRADDPAWPGPCYGAVAAKPWDDASFLSLQQKFLAKLQNL